MPLTARGYDCSWDPPDQACMVNSGYAFMVRYGSRDPSKNLTKAELDSALAKGLDVCVVWQEGKTQMTRGRDGGVTDARDADAFVKGLGLAGIPVYFSCDYDPPSGDWPKIDGYLDGVASVIGRSRTGGYGGKAFISREFDRGAIVWGWQTYAWSGSPTQWDGRAQLRQVKNDFAKCSGTIDDDEAWAPDHGQWPRPGQPGRADDDLVITLRPGRTTGVSFNGAPYTTVGFCADTGVFPETIAVRCAFRRQDGGGWWVQTAYLDEGHPKVVIGIPGPADGASFARLDDMNCDVVPNFA